MQTASFQKFPQKVPRLKNHTASSLPLAGFFVHFVQQWDTKGVVWGYRIS